MWDPSTFLRIVALRVNQVLVATEPNADIHNVPHHVGGVSIDDLGRWREFGWRSQ